MNKKKVFSLAMYYYDCLKNGYSYKEIKFNLMLWGNYCSGREVKNKAIRFNHNNYACEYTIYDCWCKEKEND